MWQLQKNAAEGCKKILDLLIRIIIISYRIFMSVELVLSLLTALGLGSILGAFFQSKFQFNRELLSQKTELKKKRYGAIIVQMLIVLDFEKNIKYGQLHRPDLRTLDDYINEIKAELLNALSYAKDDVVIAIAEFLKKNDYQTYIKAVISMRKDLWGKKTKIKENIFDNLINR